MNAQDGIASLDLFAGAKQIGMTKTPMFKRNQDFLKFCTKWGSKTKNSRARLAHEGRKSFAARKFVALRSA